MLVVGDGIYKGVPYETSQRLGEIASDLGYDVAAVITRQLPVHRRSVTSAGRRLSQEQILVLRRPRAVVLNPPNYRLFPYEQVLANREGAVLAGQGADGPVRAAFAHSYEHDGLVVPTSQFYLEASPHAGSRRKNSTYVAHGLHRYKGKFYPQLAKALLNVSGVGAGMRAVDPFGGSGTVALEANLLGADALSLDCNPVAVSVARAKTDVLQLDKAGVRGYLASLATAATRTRKPARELTSFAPAVMPEIESWFPVPVLAKLDRLLTAVRSSDDPRLVNLGQALVSDLIREVSQQDPKDLRIRRRAVAIDDAPVLELFAGKVAGLLAKLEAYWTGALGHLPTAGHATVVLGDSAASEVFPAVRAQAVVSSPPYAAALPYIDTDRLSLAAVYGYSGYDRKALETVMIGSREVSTRERRSIEEVLEQSPESLGLPDSTLTFLTSYLDAVRADENAGFRRQQAPAVLTRYFQAMSLVLGNVADHLDPASDIWLVLGDSRSVIGGVGWQIPTVDEVHWEGGLPRRWAVLPDRQAICRFDDHTVLGIFGAGYTWHQYREWLLTTVVYLLDNDLAISSAGLLRGGAIAWVEVSMPDTVTTPEGVAFRPNLLATTSFDGSIATTYKRTGTDTICDNTRQLALSEVRAGVQGQAQPQLPRPARPGTAGTGDGAHPGRRLRPGGRQVVPGGGHPEPVAGVPGRPRPPGPRHHRPAADGQVADDGRHQAGRPDDALPVRSQGVALGRYRPRRPAGRQHLRAP